MIEVLSKFASDPNMLTEKEQKDPFGHPANEDFLICRLLGKEQLGGMLAPDDYADLFAEFSTKSLLNGGKGNYTCNWHQAYKFGDQNDIKTLFALPVIEAQPVD
mmetsp:Transcript_23203/g.72497  ORF Transcript_23203/g.72497 Transcript_23203/m.72497 type:complete len:104 (-) Transcript_23203:124-435(-)